MASSAVRMSASPTHLEVKVTGDGSDSGIKLSAATVLAMLPEGPLKELFKVTGKTTAEIIALFTGSGRIEASLTPCFGVNQITGWGAVAAAPGTVAGILGWLCIDDVAGAPELHLASTGTLANGDNFNFVMRYREHLIVGPV